MGARRRRGLRGRRGVRALATEGKANGRAGELVVPLEAVGVCAVWLRCSATVTPCRSPETGDVRRPAWGFADRVDVASVAGALGRLAGAAGAARPREERMAPDSMRK